MRRDRRLHGGKTASPPTTGQDDDAHLCEPVARGMLNTINLRPRCVHFVSSIDFAHRGKSGDLVRGRLPDPDAAGLRLLVDDLGWPGPLEIGSEASPFHRKTWFALAGV